MRHTLIFLFIICFVSCEWRKYPSEKYVIPQKYRDLLSSFKTGDTLKFKDDKENLSLFLISKIDSTLHDKRGFFINAREYKEISISCHELTNTRPGYEYYYIIGIGKDPETDFTGFNIRLKDFYSIDTSLPFVLKKDTVTANNLSFTNYYSFQSYNFADQRDPNSVTKIYMTNDDGIVAYKCLNGVWWTRSK